VWSCCTGVGTGGLHLRLLDGLAGIVIFSTRAVIHLGLSGATVLV
jgi:hypothetical protein